MKPIQQVYLTDTEFPFGGQQREFRCGIEEDMDTSRRTHPRKRKSGLFSHVRRHNMRTNDKKTPPSGPASRANLGALAASTNALNHSAGSPHSQHVVTVGDLKRVAKKGAGVVQTAVGPVECGPKLFASFDSRDAPTDAKQSRVIVYDAARRTAQIVSAVAALNNIPPENVASSFSEVGGSQLINPVEIMEALHRRTTKDVAEQVVATLEGYDPNEDRKILIEAANAFRHFKMRLSVRNSKTADLVEEANIYCATRILRQHNGEQAVPSGFFDMGDPVEENASASSLHFLKSVKSSTLRRLRRKSKLPHGVPYVEHFRNGVRVNLSESEVIEVAFRALNAASGARSEADVYFDMFNRGIVRRIVKERQDGHVREVEVAAANWSRVDADKIIRSAANFTEPLHSKYRSYGPLRRFLGGFRR